ncbi:MAG TPA: cell division protein FtsH, partial [Anaerolineaceae bacterium]|nr:cell division protein FtsH [Anaerolineaceae bacterium]
MNQRNQSYLIYLLLFVAIVALLVYNYGQNESSTQALSINEVAEDVKNGQITRIVENEDKLTIYYGEEGKQGTSTKEPTATLIEQLMQLGVTADQLHPEKVRIEIKAPSQLVGVFSTIGYILPFIILGAGFFFIMRQAQGSNNAAMSFGKSRARMFRGDQPTVTFEDVAGVDESKEELREVVEFLREPQKFISLGARIPKGVLLVG